MPNAITLYRSNGYLYTTASEEYHEGHSAVKESIYEGAAEKPLPSRGMLV